MASAFSFGFSGDDIDVDESEMNDFGTEDTVHAQGAVDNLPKLLEAEKHDMKEWLSLLPSQISYNRLPIGASQGGRRKSFTLARREVFDIRTQLMAEDSADHEDNGELIAGLEKGDIKPNFYEGGFKTWECALDLAKLVVNEDLGMSALSDVNDDVEDYHIIELGAGTAMPSLALFAQLLSLPLSEVTGTRQRKTHFTFADYNAAVLRLVTLPNILLTWNNSIASQNASATTTTTSTTDNHSDTHPPTQEDELETTAELVEIFQQDLTKRGITIDFISGAWSPAFVDLVFSSRGEGNCRTLILASETIYSPSSLGAFSETLLALLRRSRTARSKSRALVAAKKVYFGVGGGVDEFLTVLKNICGDGLDIQQKLDIKTEGVGRLVLEIAESRN